MVETYYCGYCGRDTRFSHVWHAASYSAEQKLAYMVSEVQQSEDKRVALERRLAEAVALLRKMATYDECPACFSNQWENPDNNGHTPDCALAKILRENPE